MVTDLVIFKKISFHTFQGKGNAVSYCRMLREYVQRQITGKYGWDTEIVCFREHYSQNIGDWKLKFGEWIDLEVFFPMVIELVIF